MKLTFSMMAVANLAEDELTTCANGKGNAGSGKLARCIYCDRIRIFYCSKWRTPLLRFIEEDTLVLSGDLAVQVVVEDEALHAHGSLFPHAFPRHPKKTSCRFLPQPPEAPHTSLETRLAILYLAPRVSSACETLSQTQPTRFGRLPTQPPVYAPPLE